MFTPIKIGINSCLTGTKVRYDGGHSHDRFLTQTLGLFAEYVPVCPEVECGMPTPREAVRLVGDSENPRLVTQKTALDKTRQMTTWIKGRIKGLAENDLLIEEYDCFQIGHLSPVLDGRILRYNCNSQTLFRSLKTFPQ